MGMHVVMSFWEEVMSEKLSVNVEILGLNISHNFLVPDDMSVQKVINLMIRTLEDEHPGTADGKKNMHMLLQSDSGKALIPNCSMCQQGIVNGEKLLLV